MPLADKIKWMTSKEKIDQADLESLRVIRYPDPRLKELCTNIDMFDASLRRLTQRMAELMFEAKGVGLAANQVGITVQLFVASPTYEPADVRVYVNPRILSADGWEESEEGCLSLPGINTNIKRRQVVTIEAADLDGKVFQETGTELLARIFQHETDHLQGMLLVDKMGSVARLASRRTLKELEEKFSESST